MYDGAVNLFLEKERRRTMRVVERELYPRVNDLEAELYPAALEMQKERYRGRHWRALQRAPRVLDSTGPIPLKEVR